MSSQDDGPEGRQRTVAELLAQYGGGQRDADAPSGRRRRAEDAAEETAPQAIIERVRADTDRESPTPNGHAPTAHAPRPAAQGPAAQGPAAQGPAAQGPAAQPPPTQSQRPGPRPQQQSAPQPGGQPQQPAGQPPAPQQAGAPQPGGQPQQPAQQAPNQPQGNAVPARAPQRGQPQAKPQTRTAITPVAGANQDPTQFAQPPEYDEQADPARYSPAPPIPDEVSTRASVTARLAGTPPEPHTEMIQAVQDDGPPSDTETTGYYTPSFDDDDESPGEQTGYHPGPLADDDDDAEGYPGQDYSADGDLADEYAEDDYAEDEVDYEDEPRGVGEWMTLVGLIAAGVVGGGLVWLAFDWLWRTTKIGAAIAALVVIIGIVFGVRKAWRARDTATTVFAVIVGLIVTITPAALLYFGS